MNSFINYRNIWVCALFTLLSTSGILAQGEKEDNSLEFDVLKAAEVSNLENVNTKHFETAPAIYGNGIVYIWTQKRKAGLYDKNINAAFFDLKYADLSNSFAEPIVFNEQLNDAYHMSPVCFYEEGQKMLLALNNTKEKGQDGFYQMNLMTASKDSIGNWNVEEQFIYNESNYTIYHPTLSEDGKMLVFASNMSGGFGKLDLYFCLKIDNVWGAPINMGPYINTEGNDAFPRLYGDWVFFASDSRQGYGGYDIYASTNKNGVWGFPDNIGAPINSEKDDLGLIFAEDGMTGYFTSARDGGKGLDDIYKVSLSSPVVYKTPKPEDQPKPLLNFTVTIKDQRSKTNLKNAEVQLLPIDVNQNDLNSGDFNVNVLQHDKRTGEITVKLTPRMLASDKLIKIITDDKGSATASLEDGLS